MTASIASDLDTAGRALLEDATYRDDGYVYEACELLRGAAPIHYVEHPNFPALYVLTRHADIHEVEKHSKQWGQGGYPFLTTHDVKRRQDESGYSDFRTLIHYDGDVHRAYRNVTAGWFTPAALARMDARIAELARDAVDRIAAAGPECDFAVEVSRFPLVVILAMLGIPDEDSDHIFALSPKSGAGASSDSREGYVERIASYMSYWAALSESRRANPTDDLASVIANADVPGIGQMPMPDAIGYYTIFSIAGHETTSSSIAGGVHALITHPDQLERLGTNPDLLRPAVDEMVRWVTPVKHFTRRCYEPYRLADHQFDVDDLVFMSYPAANRDPAAFEAPYTFDIARHNAQDHLAFGFGAHFCLGAHLAKMEMRAFFAELLPRLESIELVGEHRTVASNSVGGTQSLPVRIAVA